MANERRLIDANALPFITLKDNSYWARSVCYKSDVDAAPTVDAVEVVRCGECMWYDIKEGCPLAASGMTHDGGKVKLPLPDDFCSYGKVGTNADDHG